MLDAAILAQVEGLSKLVGADSVPISVSASKTISSPVNGYLSVRAMAAGGAGDLSGGNGGDVAILWRHPVAKGDSIVVTIGAPGAYPGGSGGTTTITGPNGLNCSVPGGRGGTNNGTQPAANTNPTGFTDFWKGGRGGRRLGGSTANPGGGAAPVLWGVDVGGYGGDSPSGAAGYAAGGGGVGGRGGDASSGAGVHGAGGGSGGDAAADTAGVNLDRAPTQSAAKSSSQHSRMLTNVSGGGAASATKAGPGGGGSHGGAAGYGGGGSGSGSYGGSAGAPGLGGGSGASSNQSGGGSDVLLEFVGAAA